MSTPNLIFLRLLIENITDQRKEKNNFSSFLLTLY